MPFEKHNERIRVRRTSITLTDGMERMLLEMVKLREANSASDYLAGLVLIDFLQAKGLIDVSQLDTLPAWTVRAHLVSVEKGKLRPEK